MDYNLEISYYDNFKIFGYNEDEKSFEVCFQSPKKLHNYKVKGDKIEKIKEFNFACNIKDFNKAESIPSLFYILTTNNDVTVFFDIN